MPPTIKIRSTGTRAQFLAKLNREITKAFTDFTTPNGGIVAAHIAKEVFRDNWIEFKKKSIGGVDRFGLKWTPLAEETIEDKISRRRGVQKHGFGRPGISRLGKKVPSIQSVVRR